MVLRKHFSNQGEKLLYIHLSNELVYAARKLYLSLGKVSPLKLFQTWTPHPTLVINTTTQHNKEYETEEKYATIYFLTEVDARQKIKYHHP